MVNGINQYQQKYPLYTIDNIVELMLDDGIITFDIAKKIKSGTSLFLIDAELSWQKQGNDFSMSEIMGEYYTPLKPQHKTNFNRKIEPTFQPMTQGDCWLLSDINALNQTEWGKKAIEEAIIPDTDGSGGVTIKFKGSPLMQNEIHITADEIEKARNSGNYVKEDDDVIAFELATEKTFRVMVKLGLAERVDNDESMEKLGIKYRSFISGGVKTDKFEQYPISELLGIETYELKYSYLGERINEQEEKQNLFKWIVNNQNNLSMTCSFDYAMGGYGDEKGKDYIHGGHAYAIKDIDYGKEVTVIDPHYSNYEIKVPWDIFVDSIRNLNLSFNKPLNKKQFKSVLPKNFENFISEADEYYKNTMDALDDSREDVIKNIYKKADDLNLSGTERENFIEKELDNVNIMSYKEYLLSKKIIKN